MGFESVNSGDGYTKFDKGANLYVQADDIDDDKDSYQGDEYFQLVFQFNAVPENGGEPGRVPAWITSKITIGDSAEHTSKLAQLLDAAGIIEDVLRELGADDTLVEDVLAGEERYEAKTRDENMTLKAAVAKHLGKTTLRVGSKYNASEEYSVVKDFYETVETDPFADDPAAHADTDAAADAAAEAATEQETVTAS